MNQDFVTQLQLQLREAALREERRTPAAQRFVRARRGLPGPAPLAAALAVALLALAVAIGVLQLHDDAEPVKPKVDRQLQREQRPVVDRVRLRCRLGRGPDQAARCCESTRRRTVSRSGSRSAARSRSPSVRGAVWALGGDLLTAGAHGRR